MERPFAGNRPIGPFLQSIEPVDESLLANEIRVLLGELTRSIESNIDLLESARDDEMPEGTVDRALRMTRFNKGTLDSAAQKLAAKHEEAAGVYPEAWREYQELAEERDELIEEIS